MDIQLGVDIPTAIAVTFSALALIKYLLDRKEQKRQKSFQTALEKHPDMMTKLVDILVKYDKDINFVFLKSPNVEKSQNLSKDDVKQIEDLNDNDKENLRAAVGQLIRGVSDIILANSTFLPKNFVNFAIEIRETINKPGSDGAIPINVKYLRESRESAGSLIARFLFETRRLLHKENETEKESREIVANIFKHYGVQPEWLSPQEIPRWAMKRPAPVMPSHTGVPWWATENP